jgi:hypothetical protein
VSKKSDRSLTRFLGDFLRQKWVDRGEVWPLERLGPDWRFLLERIAGAKPSDNLDDRYRRALLNLLSNCLRMNIPLSQSMLDQVVEELKLEWYPEHAAERRRAERRRGHLLAVELKRAALQRIEAINRKRGVKRPRSMAKEEVARAWGHNSGEALRKDLQAHRVHGRTTSKPA